MKLKSIHKILFITLSNIGDVILTLPVLSALRDNFKDAVIDVVVGPRPEQVFKKDPRINRIFIYDKHAGLKDKIAFIKELRSERYDLAIDMKSSLFPVLVGARHRTALLHLNKSGSRHKRAAHLDRLRPLGITYKGQKNIYIDEKDRLKIEILLRDKGISREDILIGISPGSKSYLKQWHKEGFAEVIKGILKQPGHKVILIGDINELALSREISEAVNLPGLIDLTGKTDLNELFALIERFKLLLTCDSASLHIASDLGIRIVSIFGPTDPLEYGPRGERDVVIRKNLKCSPCKKALCKLGTHECMSSISAEEVLSAIGVL
jgi:lipopolysaccharide heptosyltransferase II